MESRSAWCLFFAFLSLSVLLGGLGPASAASPEFVIVTRSGAQIPASGPPRISGSVAYFRTPKGTPVAIHLANLDVATTEKLNGVDLPIEVGDYRPVAAAGGAGEDEPYAASDRAVAGYTITNADLRRLRAGRLFLEGGDLPEFTAKEQAVQDGQLAPEVLRNELRAQWESRSKALQARSQELMRREELLRSQAKDLEQSILTLGAGSAQKFGAQLDTVKDQLQQVQGELEVVERSQRALQEEARRAGVPPEWLR